jgi:hypothetical protein
MHVKCHYETSKIKFSTIINIIDRFVKIVIKKRNNNLVTNQNIARNSVPMHSSTVSLKIYHIDFINRNALQPK